MSKKTLLNEATVRRFMKLADMGTLSDNFINEAGLYQADEDEAMDEGHGMMGAAYQDDEPEEMDMGEEEPIEEMEHAGKRDEKELDEVELVDENDLVQEVTRRVAARLRAAMKSRK